MHEMRKIIRLIFCLCALLTLQKATADVSIAIVPDSRVLIIPGVDLIRQPISTIILDADQPYSIALSDNNGGSMVSGYHGIPYSVSYNNNTELRLTANPLVMESGGSVAGANRSIAVTILGADTAWAAAGDYTTTLTVTITGF